MSWWSRRKDAEAAKAYEEVIEEATKEKRGYLNNDDKDDKNKNRKDKKGN